ncbi:type VI secretion system tip protein VgrG [Rhodanobacter glycinis]|uniref:Type VI secretion system tip protein VgrG n=1 Tax=Rhodanobacter glycinis TaxID=582702 RepID=A0A502FEV7_9GAMM|nr:type VI secretion system tip protein VgrG [Rhodanobacter glycinis]TPG47891.1 type VI secretion system tip protein VgrG [Rhodanobacter glycinis]
MTHRMTLKSDLGDKLLPASLSGSEQLGRLFSYQLKLLSKDSGIKLLDLLGTSMTVTLDTGDFKRHFNGIVSEISQIGFESFQNERHAEYAVTLVPKPWLLLHKVDCRIYTDLSVPDIIKTVLSEVGCTDVKLSLSGSYPVREYCVQYREDYFNFISRLMEQEGIYYFFQHSDNTHTMVLADSLGAHSATGGFDELPYRPQGEASRGAQTPAIQDFSAVRSMQTTKYSLTDYDPLKPRTSLLGDETISNADSNHNVMGLESFDYPGDHVTGDVGKHYAQVRIEALNVQQSLCSGSTTASGLLTGALFKLAEFPRKELNLEYLVTGSTVHIEDDAYHSGKAQGGDLFFCNFSAIRSGQPFRTMPTAVRPMVVGLQTAVVAGSDTAEDISVDKYGRIQVIFHWNKTDKKNWHISCPVRVASAWAGKNWGAVNIPRVGQEVVISFLEGDPDRPLVIGSVYNADNMPPYTLPDNKTQSGIKSRSHEGGGADDFNEIRFEDKKGSEELYLHAQKDMREEVENDHFVDIDHDETVNIKNDQTENIKHDRKLTVGNDDKLDVTQNATTTVGQKFKLSAGTEIELVTGASSIVMKSDGSIEIKGVNIKVSGSMGVKVDGQVEVGIKAGATMDIGAGASLKMHSDAMLEVAGGAMATVKGPMLTLKGDAMTQVSGAIIMIG